MNLLEVIRTSGIDLIGMHAACSSDEYCLTFLDELPIKESNPLRP